MNDKRQKQLIVNENATNDENDAQIGFENRKE